MTTATAPADWYPDPHGSGRTRLRYWDGRGWTEHVHDLAQTPAAAAADDAVARTAVVQSGPPDDDEGASSPDSVSRRFASDLLTENTALRRELAGLRRVIAGFGIEDAVRRSEALEDLAAEHAVQERRLGDLIAEIRRLESRLGSVREHEQARS